MKFIFVSGGVLSGLGKGITTSSIGLLLKACGYKVMPIKIDPYLNVDAGTMNPFEHGEVFVLDDGSEADLDLGNYERFLDMRLGHENNITTGKVYKAVIEKERRGDYLGKTVQIIPHITDEIKMRIEKVASSSKADIILIEMGGTVGDIESMPFLEAARQLHIEHGHGNVIFVHTTLVPVMGVVGEQKTKPTQHSVKELMSLGIQPDVIVCRSDSPLAEDTKRKIAMFCDVPLEAIVSAYDVQNVYQVPLLFEKQGLVEYLQKVMHFKPKKPDTKAWNSFVEKVMSRNSPKVKKIKVAIVGKYTGLKDSYISHFKALDHASTELGLNVEIIWIDAEQLTDAKCIRAMLGPADAIIIPGGFGTRGIEGKIAAAKFAREKKVPFVGICLGFQISVIEFCRSILGLKGANSSEFEGKEHLKHPVICILPEQKDLDHKGGTMRLGIHTIKLQRDSLAYSLYKNDTIHERHRHRYEVNPDYIDMIQKCGYNFSGRSEDNKRMEVAELDRSVHPYFIAVQFHPEFMSRPMKPIPLYLGLLKAANKKKK